ncbi:hypothetical protein O181_038268 [Austropuccinia psidii MF-1]|uniref:Polynucleotide 5'-hydroxyl-kinase GRC3 n=1 Tax=Austropuccinia psidii MF-1 TaxID=1389203 RepID=A0A9Q3DD03_9BASI|nr:hypothetical protein [Austropuccinia psidii MF-1]
MSAIAEKLNSKNQIQLASKKNSSTTSFPSSKSSSPPSNSFRSRSCPKFYATNQLLNLYLPFQPSHQNSSSIHCKRYCRHPNQHNQTKKSNPPSINTMGWKQGIGRELLYQLIQSIQPTKIFSFSEDESSNPIHSNDLEISKMQPISPTPLSSGLTPADHCTLSLLSYLYSNPRPSSGQFGNLWEFNQPLWCRRPFEVKPQTIQLPDHLDFNGDHLGYILDGSMIGFVDQNEKWWLRFGLICAINPIQKTIHLVTPACPNIEQ